MGWFINIIVMSVLAFIGGRLLAYPVPVDFAGKLQRWNINESSAPITYGIKGTPQDIANYASVIYDAIQLWQSAPGSYLTFEESADPDAAQIIVNFTSSGVGENSSGYADVKTNSDGWMSSCRIELLVGSNIAFVSFEKTSLHEIGHCVGLGHSLIPQAIMSYEPEKSDFALDTDDIAGIARLYPVGDAKPSMPPGCGIARGNQPIPYGWLWFVIVPVGLGLLKRGGLSTFSSKEN